LKLSFDNPFFEFLTTATHFIGLNILFLITCVPIFTIGPALAALYSVTIKESLNENGYMTKRYLKAFKSNFKQGVGATFFFLLTAAIFLFNLSFWYSFNTVFAQIIFVVILAATVILFICFIYAFPLMARYENPLKQTLKNALFVGMENLKFTLLIMLILVTVAAFTFWYSMFSIFMLFLGFSFLAYCLSFLFNKIFEKYNEQKKVQEENAQHA